VQLKKTKKKFRVLVEGGHLLMDFDRVEAHGYFTTRFVSAYDAEEAAAHAFDLIANELRSTVALLNDLDDPPTAKVVDVVELVSFKGIHTPGAGFTFFPAREDD
jgi:hypothetical protein